MAGTRAVRDGAALRMQVDADVRSFQYVDLQHVFVLGLDGNLWLEPAPFWDCTSSEPKASCWQRYVSWYGLGEVERESYGNFPEKIKPIVLRGRRRAEAPERRA